MSGIAGIIYFTKKPVGRLTLEDMSSKMAHRGTDGIFFHTTGHAGFCNLVTYDTPESRHETLPYITPDKKLTLVFHGRIDNRKELFIHTEQRDTLAETPDSLLVLAAFKKWGFECIKRLLGDFAFAIWDYDRQTLYCGRDHMGVKPFFYLKTDSYFAFSSEIKGLFAVPDFRKKINLERAADFPICVTTENQATFYENIFRLQPAHFLTVQNSTVKEKRYWSLEPTVLGCKDSLEYQEAFHDIFKDAVHARLRSDSSLGAYLSGGLDSSSIVCMAAGPLNNSFPGKLNTFSGIFKHIPECDERSYFQPVLDHFDLRPHFIYADEVDPGSIFDSLVDSEDEPIYSPHFFMSWHLLHMAQQRGIRVLLDGYDGDSAVSHGYGLLPQLAIQGKLTKLYRELMGFPYATRKNTIRNILYMYRGLLLDKMPFHTYYPPNKREWLRKLAYLTPECLSKTDAANRLKRLMEKLPDSYQTEQKRHRLSIIQPFHPLALEFLERAASRFSINQYFPFFDIRLISFCLALPAEQKLKNGYNRNIVRNSLESLLPTSIRDRKTKSNFNKNLVDAYTVRDREWFAQSVHNSHPKAYDIINRDRVTESYNECVDGKNPLPVMALNNILLFLALAKWFDKTENKDLEFAVTEEIR